MKTSQRDHTHNLPCSPSQNERTPPQDPDYFSFLKTNEEKHSRPSPFFSEKGLSQDILDVTGAEPDICLEAFYALYNTLWPQIDKFSDISFTDTWRKFIGGSIVKGSLTPPEKLITEKKMKDIRRVMSESGGENRIFKDLDNVVRSISDLKQKVKDYPGQILQKKEIIESLGLVQDFYLEFRKKMITLVQDISEKEEMNTSFGSQYGALEDLLEPRAIMMSDSFSQHWAYRIPRNKAQKLLSLDANSRNLGNNLDDPSNHRVIALPENLPRPLVFFKANGNVPIQPEKEFMVSRLYRHLRIPVPETTLLILTDAFEANPEAFYAVQASEAVLGESSLKACQNPETIFDQEAYTAQVIGALLTNPSDGSFKNFKYSSKHKTLISIDNDLIFKPELTGEENKKNVNVKSILYLLPQIDHPIPKPTKTFFTTLDPYLTIFAWLQDLSQKNKKYQLLFARLSFQQTRFTYQNLPPQGSPPSPRDCIQTKVHVDSDLHGDSFCPKILVSKNLVENLIKKLQKIENILLKSPTIRTQALFEQVSPVLGKYYQKIRTLFSDPEIALNALWGDKINGVDYSLILSQLAPQELNSLAPKSFLYQPQSNESIPEDFFKDCKDGLALGESPPLDLFIRHHSQRKKENSLNLQEVLQELRLLAQEGLTDSQYPRDIADFYESISRMMNLDLFLMKEITSLFSNLPNPELKWLLTLEKYFIRPEREQYLPKGSFPSSIPILGAFMKQRKFMLTQSEKQYIFESQGNLKSHSSLTGRSNVTYFPEQTPEFYLKQYPECPGYELASISFMRLLGIKHLPYQDLIIINNSLKDSSYPVLLTQTIHGEPVHKVWSNPQAFSNLDPFHTGLLIISAMLLNPEDGKEDNFILSPDKRYLIPIDNDHCFLPSTYQKKGSFWNAFTVNIALQTKTLLFSLEEMIKPIPQEVKKSILAINWNLLLPKWMTELVKIEERLDNLVDSDQRSQFLEHGTAIRMIFYKQFIDHLHWKAHTITNILKTISDPTPFDLLKAVEPFAAKRYQDSFKEGDTLEKRFKAVTHLLYTKTSIDGSRVSLLNTRAMMQVINISEKDLVNEAFFRKMGPLEASDLLNQLIQEQNDKKKIEQEFLDELDEKEQGTKLSNAFGNLPVEEDLKAFFTDPKEVLVLKESKLIVSSKLTTFFGLTSHRGMKIRFLSLLESPVLTDKEIRILAQECLNLEYLNVSGCINLKEIITAEGEWPLLARLEAKNCLSLEKFVSLSPMRILRIETTSKIQIFIEKSTLDIFIISTKINQFELSLRKGEEFEIKSQGQLRPKEAFLFDALDKHEEIEQLFRDLKITIGKSSILSGRDLEVLVTALNFSSSKVSGEKIQRLTMLKLINLKKLNLSRISLEMYSLEHIIQGDWPKLDHLDLSHNNVTDVGIKILSQGNWPLLETLNLQNTRITTTGVKRIINQAKWTQLKYLDLSQNPIDDEGLKIIGGGNWPLFETLDLNSTNITRKGVLNFDTLKRNWPNLRKIIFPFWVTSYGAEFSERNRKNLLEMIDLSSAELTNNEIKIFVKKNFSLMGSLDLSKNQMNAEGLSILCQKNMTLIETIHLHGTTITEAEVEVLVNQAKWTNLKHLNLSHNPINDKALEILPKGNWPLLETLDISSTNITKKGVLIFTLKLNWPNIKEIKCDLFGKNFATSLLPKNWPLLEELDLSWSELAQNEIKFLVRKFELPQLKHLDLSGNEIDDEELEILSHGKWPLLETLNLKGTGGTKKAIFNLLLNENWPNLKEIECDFFGMNFSKSSFSADRPLLEELDLGCCKFPQNEVEGIVKKSHWPQLKSLNVSLNYQISNPSLTKKGFLNLVLNVSWPNLKAFITPENWNSAHKLALPFLQNTFPQVKNLEAMLKKNKYQTPQLNHLDRFKNISCEGKSFVLLITDRLLLAEFRLEGPKLLPKGITMIGDQSQWPQLKHLNMPHNQTYDEGFPGFAFVEWPSMESFNLNQTKTQSKKNRMKQPNLKKLSLPQNTISHEALTSEKGSWLGIPDLIMTNPKLEDAESPLDKSL